jgi:hypothetical protein
MNLGEILDRAFEIYRKRFFAFAGLSAIPAFAVFLVNMADEFWWKTHPPDLALLFGSFNIGLLFYWLAFFHVSTILQLLLYPSITHLCSAETLGEPSSISESLRAGFRDWRANVGMALIQIAMVLILPEVVCFVLFAGAGALEAWLNVDTTEFGGAFAPTFLFFLATGIAAYFWMWSRVALSWAASDRENLSGKQALRRSFSLSRGRRRAIFLSQPISATIWLSFTTSVAVLARLVYLGLRAEGLAFHVLISLYITTIMLGRLAVNTIICPIFPIVATLFYYDQRVRKEGFDVERLIEAAGIESPQFAPDPEPTPSQQAEEPV